MEQQNFYREIKALKLPVAEVMKYENIVDVPSDWSIVMHIGSISVSELIGLGAANQNIKMQFGDSLRKAIIQGNGLRLAERLIKGSARSPNTSDVVRPPN